MADPVGALAEGRIYAATSDQFLRLVWLVQNSRNGIDAHSKRKRLAERLKCAQAFGHAKMKGRINPTATRDGNDLHIGIARVQVGEGLYALGSRHYDVCDDKVEFNAGAAPTTQLPSLTAVTSWEAWKRRSRGCT